METFYDCELVQISCPVCGEQFPPNEIIPTLMSWYSALERHVDILKADVEHQKDYNAISIRANDRMFNRCLNLILVNHKLATELSDLEATAQHFPTIAEYENIRDDLEKSEARCEDLARENDRLKKMLSLF